MKPPLFVRPLSTSEREQLRAGLRSADSFTVRRSQILLTSDAGSRPSETARTLAGPGGAAPTATPAFHPGGAPCPHEKSSRPHPARPPPDARHVDALKDLLHHSPRLLGEPTSL